MARALWLMAALAVSTGAAAQEAETPTPGSAEAAPGEKPVDEGDKPTDEGTTSTETTSTETTSTETTSTETTSTEGTPPAEGTATEGTATEGTATEGTATEGTATEGTATDGTATDGTATDGTATEDSSEVAGHGPAGEEAASSQPAEELSTGAVGLVQMGTAKVIFASIWSPTEVIGPGIEPGTFAPVETEVPVGTHAVIFSPDGGKPFTVWVTVLAAEEGAEPGRVIVDPTGKRIVATAGNVFADLAQPMPTVLDRTSSGAPATDGGAVCRKGRPCMTAGPLAVWPRARVRAAFEFQQPDFNTLFIGNNDGFRLDQARFGFGGAYKDTFTFSLTAEGAAFLPGAGANQPVQPLSTVVVDAYAQYRPIQYFNIWAGQTFMPSDYEGGRSRAGMIFTDRSVLSGGVRAGRGYQVAGLSPGREIGLVVGAQDARIGPVSLDYVAAVSNGNGVSVFGNDNKLPAAHVRVGGGWERFFVVGLGGSYNPRTTGQLPNLYNETDLQGFVDFKADFMGFDFLAQAIVRETTFDSVFPEVTDPGRVAFGYGATAWLALNEPFGLPMLGIKPGYRISYYDPTTSFSDDQLLEHTLGVRYDPTTYDLPIALMIDATMLMEFDSAGLRPLDNNRLVALVQFDL